jgi:hypothetical protein
MLKSILLLLIARDDPLPSSAWGSGFGFSTVSFQDYGITKFSYKKTICDEETNKQMSSAQLK